MNQYPNAAAGLRLMFIGQILTIVGALLIWVPIVGPLIGIAGTALELVGIYKAGEDDENYRGALRHTDGAEHKSHKTRNKTSEIARSRA